MIWIIISLYGVIGYHMTLSEGHMIAITPYKETLVPHLVATLIYLSQIYSYYKRGDTSLLRSHILSIVINLQFRGLAIVPLLVCTHMYQISLYSENSFPVDIEFIF